MNSRFARVIYVLGGRLHEPIGSVDVPDPYMGTVIEVGETGRDHKD